VNDPDSSTSNAGFEPSSLAVDLGKRSYEIVIGEGVLARSAEWMSRWMAARGMLPEGADTPIAEQTHPDLSKGTACIVTDGNVAEPYARLVRESLSRAGAAIETVVLESGEQTKRLDVVSGLYDQLVAMKADRQTLLVAVGGGVVGDTAGFAAATYARGIPFVQIPTTLLAQVDSSVGGKVGINHPQGKNLIGAFYQPFGVLIDTNTLSTLPDREYRSGLAEVVKYGAILDDEFFRFLESHTADINRREPNVMQQVIARCCRLKADVVQQDEEERSGLRSMLNYGHTFAHALESLCGYGTLLHGEAVAIGMVCAAHLAERLQRISPALSQRQHNLLQELGLPTVLPTECAGSSYELLERMRLDKKAAGGRLRFILPTRLGAGELVADVPENEVTAVLDSRRA